MSVSQHLAEALGPLSKEKEKLLNDYNDLKVKLNRENEELAKQNRNYQREFETLLETTSKIEEYVVNLRNNILVYNVLQCHI